MSPAEAQALAGKETANAESGFARWLARADDRLNPILVKEVRQALRGRYFRNLFWLTVVLATGIGVFMIFIANVNGDVDELGPNFFTATFGVLSFAVHTFVPFWAFQSMGAEWEENTYDLLVISDLRPRQMVLGKVLAATVQGLLYYSAFTPFLVSTFLMGGVDILAIAVLIGLSLLASITLSFVAVAFSTLGKTKIVRAGLAMLLAGALLPMSFGAIGFGTLLVQESSVLRDPDFLLGLAFFATALPLVSLFACAIGCARLAHEEENRSTLLRILTSTITLVTLGWSVYVYGFLFRGDAEWLAALTSIGIVASSAAYLFFVTEAEPFGRRVAQQVPRSTGLALLALPWLPGGARGVALIVVHGVLAVLVTAALALPLGDPEVVAFVAVFQLYAFAIFGLPSGIAAFGIRSLRGRTAVRVLIPLGVGLAAFLPALVGFVADHGDWMRFEHPFNPVYVLACVASQRWEDATGGLVVLGATVLFALIANTKRVARAVAETQRCAQARREREARHAARDAEPSAGPSAELGAGGASDAATER
ncbi:MAG: hypothetical protein L6Q99_18970 [Planctomycetes bacterium]|nr:hypothetical protein [Planctomycetota bacterium]